MGNSVHPRSPAVGGCMVRVAGHLPWMSTRSARNRSNSRHIVSSLNRAQMATV